MSLADRCVLSWPWSKPLIAVALCNLSQNIVVFRFFSGQRVMSVGRYQIGLCTQYTSPLLITITVHWNLCSTNDRELFQPSTARVCLNRIVKGVGRFRDRLSLLPSFICYVNGSSQDIQVCKLISILLVPWLVGYLIHICFSGLHLNGGVYLQWTNRIKSHQNYVDCTPIGVLIMLSHFTRLAHKSKNGRGPDFHHFPMHIAPGVHSHLSGVNSILLGPLNMWLSRSHGGRAKNRTQIGWGGMKD